MTLKVALISSDRLRVHTTRNRPFTGSDKVTGPDDGDPDGSCIVLVGGTERSSGLTVRCPS